MDYHEVVGLVVLALIAILGFFINIKKTMVEDKKPIEELNLNIVELNANFRNMLENDKVRDVRITTHGKEIDDLKLRQKENEKTIVSHDLRIKRVEDEILK